MSESHWKTKALEPAPAVRRAVDAVVFAVINHGEDEPPVRPWTFKILDEHGVEREVYAPPGHVTRWPWP